MGDPEAAGAPGGEETERPRRRKRGLLKLYYGTQEEAAQPANPLDIDGTTFQPEQYLSKLYGSYDLSELMSREEHLSKQIKALDSDMQTLVYENYNKFISATDTIRNMKSQVEGMEDEISRLTENMKEINTLSGSINDKFADKRERIRKLSSGHTLLKKLQFLFELPRRLKQCVDMKAYPQAVNYYHKASGILHHYRNMSSFKKIYDDCEEIIVALKSILFGQLRQDKSLEQTDLVEVIGLLLRLKCDPLELSEEILSRAKASWVRNREKQQAILSDKEEEASKDPASPDPKVREADISNEGERINDENNGAEDREEQDYEGEEEEVEPSPLLKYMEFGNQVLLFDLAEWLISYQDVFDVDASEEQDDEAAKDDSGSPVRTVRSVMLEFVDELLTQYLKSVKELVIKEQLEDNYEDLDSVDLVQALEIFHRGLAKMDTLIPSAGLAGQSMAVIVASVRALCGQVGRHLMTVFDQGIETLISKYHNNPDDPKGLMQSLHKIGAILVAQAGSSLEDLLPVTQASFASQHRYFRSEFPSRGVRSMAVQGFFSYVVQYASEFANLSAPPLVSKPGSPMRKASAPQNKASSVPEDRPLIIWVLLAHLCDKFSSTLVEQIVQKVAELFPPLDNDGPMSPRTGSIDIGDADKLTVAEHSRIFKHTATAVLTKYTGTRGTELSMGMEREIFGSQWLSVSAPTGPSRYISEIIKKLQEETELIYVSFNQSYEKADHSQSSVTKVKPGFRTGDGMSSGLRNLFSERVDIFDSVDFRADSVCLGVIKIILQGYLETVRLITFSSSGLQQIEVDVYKLYLFLSSLKVEEEDSSVIVSLLSPIITSAVCRCPEPTQLDPDDIEQLCMPSASTEPQHVGGIDIDKDGGDDGLEL